MKETLVDVPARLVKFTSTVGLEEKGFYPAM